MPTGCGLQVEIQTISNFEETWSGVARQPKALSNGADAFFRVKAFTGGQQPPI
jgi:hypothetical protein